MRCGNGQHCLHHQLRPSAESGWEFSSLRTEAGINRRGIPTTFWVMLCVPHFCASWQVMNQCKVLAFCNMTSSSVLTTSHNSGLNNGLFLSRGVVIHLSSPHHTSGWGEMVGLGPPSAPLQGAPDTSTQRVHPSAFSHGATSASREGRVGTDGGQSEILPLHNGEQMSVCHRPLSCSPPGAQDCASCLLRGSQ